MRQLVFVAAMITLSPLRSTAQTPTPNGTVIVVGVVRDTLGNPLNGAEIYTLSGQSTSSNDKGEFYLDNVPAGSIDLVFRRIGYLPATLGFGAQPGLKVSVAAKMVSATQVLSTIVVEGRSMAWGLYKTGFYEREEQKLGFYITPEQLEKTKLPLSALIRRVPRFQVETSSGTSRVTLQNMFGKGRCSPPILVDGAPAIAFDRDGIDDLVKRKNILGVELYEMTSKLPKRLQNSQAISVKTDVAAGARVRDQARAVAFEPSNSNDPFRDLGRHPCGVILIWTK